MSTWDDFEDLNNDTCRDYLNHVLACTSVTINQAIRSVLDNVSLFMIWPGIGLWTGTWPRACK